MALTNKQVSKWADELWDNFAGIAGSGDAAVYTLSDGREIRLEIVPDEVMSLDEFSDCYGSIELDHKSCYTGYSRRPDGFNGAARKFSTRDTDYWWQPPADLVNDPENCAEWFKIVRDYYNGEWWYVGVVVTIDKPACECGHTRIQHNDSVSLWGIESNAGEDYFKETIRELIREALSGQGGFACRLEKQKKSKI